MTTKTTAHSTSPIVRTYMNNSNKSKNVNTAMIRHRCSALLQRRNHQHYQHQSPAPPSCSSSSSSFSRQGRRYAHSEARPSSLKVQCDGRQQTVLNQQKQQQQQHIQLQFRRNKSTSMANPQTAAHTATAPAASSSSAAARRSSVIDIINNVLNTPREIPIPRWISPQRHTFTVSECFGHASFFLVAVSYAVDDFLQLRLIAIAGSTAMLVFTYFHPHGRVLWLPFKVRRKKKKKKKDMNLVGIAGRYTHLHARS